MQAEADGWVAGVRIKARPTCPRSSAFIRIKDVFAFAQQAKQFALRARRFGGFAFAARLADQRPQVLVVDAGMRGNEIGQRGVALFAQQVFAQGFKLVQYRRFACARRLVVGERGTRGGEVVFVVRAHQFREVRELAFVGDVRRRALYFADFVADGIGQRQLVEAGGRKVRKLPREGKHVQRFAAARATAGAVVVGTGWFGWTWHGRYSRRSWNKGQKERA